jgi:uncharacterized protein YbcI
MTEPQSALEPAAAMEPESAATAAEPEAGNGANGTSGQGLSATITREMVRLYKERFGRGPTKAHTLYARDVVLCTLEDSFTPVERNLAEMGEHQRLRDTRLCCQHALEDEFRGVIEQLTGRRVRSFVSGVDASRDLSAELFYLEPKAT